MLAAHEDVGLLLREGRDGDYAFAFPHLAPWKVRRRALLAAGAAAGESQ